jgi:hypothetical protein
MRCFLCGNPLSSWRNEVLGDDTCSACRHREALAEESFLDEESFLSSNHPSECECSSCLADRAARDDAPPGEDAPF